MSAKRAMDVAVAGAGLLLAAPLIAASALAVRATMGSPVFFRQWRAGYRGRHFQILKMRTMTDERDAEGRLLPNARRLTRVGRVLRNTSLDELPQLWNVLRGDMSLVGPRPLPVEYLPLYTPEQARRHDVRPGITGWTGVNGRNTLGWDERFALDLYYVDHQSLRLDLKILALTVLKVLRREGASGHGPQGPGRFQGSAAEDA